MKLPYAKIETFAKKPDAGVKAVLLYGPDAGLVSERSRQLLDAVVDDKSDPFRVVEFSFDNIKEEPARLYDEINAMSLLGGRRFIRITDSSASLPEELGEAVVSSKSDTMVVFEAGELSPTSSLRKFFEKEEFIVALPCYKDDAGAVRKVVEARLREAGFAYDSDAVMYLTQSFAGDRLVILAELEKLLTYMGSEKRISLTDVKACIGDNVESSLDDLCAAVASRDIGKTEKHLSRIFAEGMGAIAPLRSVLRYFTRMQQVKASVAAGMGAEQAIATLKPPVFFKQMDIFKNHLQNWNDKAVNSMVIALTKLEAECKQTGSPAELLLLRFLCVQVGRK